MDEPSSSGSNISVDSLEKSFKRKVNLKHKTSDDNIETILVPFYENDVLIRVPKGQQARNAIKSNKVNEKSKTKSHKINYLVNKDKQNQKKSSYLDIFRKQFAPRNVNKSPNRNEIRSMSPEFGDTERDSFDEEISNPVTEFCNTEAYNEMYYAKILNLDNEYHKNNSFEEEFKFTGDANLESLSNRDTSLDNLRSISDVSNPRRRRRQKSLERTQGVKLGGLGPDMEKIKPRLERARSLQRYSEKVRIENRLKIYRKTNQIDNKNREEQANDKRQGYRDRKHQRGAIVTYLVNKSKCDYEEQSVDKKPKSAQDCKTQPRNNVKIQNLKPISASKYKKNQKDFRHKLENQTKAKTDVENNARNPTLRLVSGSKTTGVNTYNEKVPPVHISFMVNVEGVALSSALQTLEEKHRMYQEQVKAFTDNNKM